MFDAQTLVCPSCGATLRNVSVVLRKIACLNCGAKFAAPNPATTETPSIAPELPTEEPAEAPLGREPKAAGYWMLRIAAMLYATFTLVAFAVYLVFGLRELLTESRVTIWMILHFSGWMCVLPFTGWLAVVLTRALARIEAGSLRAGWRNGLLTRALPADRKSSLPYMGPCIIAGGMIPALFLRESTRNAMQLDEIAPFIVSSLLCVLIAFLLLDVRQFVFRQIQLALALAGARESEKKTPLSAWALGALAAAVLFLFSLLPLIQLLFDWKDFDQWNYVLFWVSLLWCCSITVFLLGKEIGTGVRLWSRLSPPVWNWFEDALALLALIGIFPVILAALASAVATIDNMSSYRGGSYESVFIVEALNSIALQSALANFLFFSFVTLRAWRKAQQRFWTSRLSFRAPGLPVLTLITLTLALFWLAIMGIESVILVIVESNRFWMRTVDYFILANITVDGVYLGLWVFASAREIFLVEALTRAASEHAAPDSTAAAS